MNTIDSKTSTETAQCDGSLDSELRLAAARKCEEQSTKLRCKWLPFRFLLIICLITAAHSMQAALVAHLKFDGNLNDETSNHTAATINPAETPIFVPGTNGSALQITTYGNAIDLGNPSTIDLHANFTITCWIKTATQGSELELLYNGPSGSPSGNVKQWSLSEGGIAGGGNGMFFYDWTGHAYGMSWEGEGITVQDDTWHFVAISMNASAFRHITMFVDGYPKVWGDPGYYWADDFVPSPVDPGTVMRIGAGAPAGVLVGLVDDYQIYNQALDTNQLQYLFNNPGQVILPPVLPVIIQQPQPAQTVTNGATVTLDVRAEALKPLSYQWTFMGTNVPGATTNTLTLTNVTKSQAGAYRAVVSTADGTTPSDLSTLYVIGENGEPDISINMYAGVNVIGLVGRTHRIEYVNALGNTNDWQLLTTVVLPSSPYLYFDLQSPSSPKRFYRAVLVP